MTGSRESGSDDSAVYFFPDEEMTAAEVRRILAEGGDKERAWVVSHLLRYAQWEDIWTFVSRDEVRELFPRLDLEPPLRQAWARNLKIEAPVG